MENEQERSTAAETPEAFEQSHEEEVQPGRAMSIVSLVLGIASLAAFWIPVFPMLTGLAGAVVGLVAKKTNRKGTGIAMLGLVTGAAAFLLSLVWFVYLYFVLAG